MILREKMTKLQGKTQLWGHNVPINCSKLLGVRKRNETHDESFQQRHYT